MITQLEPMHILDVRMFSKRIGSISYMGVPEGIQLVGMDFFLEIHFSVWDNIYDSIVFYEKFFWEGAHRAYGLAAALGAKYLKKLAQGN